MDKYTPIVTAYGQMYADSDGVDKYTPIVTAYGQIYADSDGLWTSIRT